MAEKEGLLGASLRLALRVRCAHSQSLPAIVSNPLSGSNPSLTSCGTNKKAPSTQFDEASFNGGERGIRTLDTLLTYTPLAGERLQPLGHFS